MCGIVGFAGRSSKDGLDHMTNTLQHRGPDDRGTWTTCTGRGWVGLGSTRLAILDLSPAGRMPMRSEDGRYTLVYNGELYNSPDLRRRLAGLGYAFRSNGDTEVVLTAYLEFGSKCVELFNGMFALALWDSPRERLFLARDHFGIKPLYVVQSNTYIAFASEVKALLSLPEIRAEINYHALGQYLSYLWVPEPQSLFDGIEKLPAGHYGILENGRWVTRRYWDLRFPAAEESIQASNEPELVAELEQRLVEAVNRQTLSDAPVGAFLSAGVDSNTVVAAMASSGEPLHTFTVSFAPKYRAGAYGFDDPAVARRAAECYESHHEDLVVDPDVVDLLPKLIWHMDEPVADPAIITAYLVNRAASESVKVLLSGVGGDEVFGGYRKYLAHRLAGTYQRIPQLLRDHIIEPAVSGIPPLPGQKVGQATRLLKKMIRSGSLAPVDRFLMDGTYLTASQKKELTTPAVWPLIENGDPRAAHLDAFSSTTHADFLDQMMYVDMKTFMPSLNLLYNDKMSMATSVEVRVPFLDVELVEWVVAHVPASLKVKGRVTKYALRRAMENRVGSEVLRQAKTGFGAPADVWLRSSLYEMMRDLLSPDRVASRKLFRPDVVQKMIADHSAHRAESSFQLWQLLSLELWMQQFVDRTPVETGLA